MNIPKYRTLPDGVRQQSQAATALWLVLLCPLIPKACPPKTFGVATALHKRYAFSRQWRDVLIWGLEFPWNLVLGVWCFRLPLFLCLLNLALTGCKTFRPVEDLTRYYVLSPSAVGSTADQSNQNLTIGIASIEIPAYLQNSRIVVRRGPNEIHYSEYREWAEHVDKGLQRVLAADISILKPGVKTITSAWQSSDVKAEVRVTIHRFELDESGEATLDCEWRIASPNGQAIHTDHALINKKGPPLANNPSAAINTLSETLADLSKKIVAAFPTS